MMVGESDIELDDLGTLGVGDVSDLTSGSEGYLLKSDGEVSNIEPCLRSKSKRLGKRRRQRLQRKLAGISLGSITEEPSANPVCTPKRSHVGSGTTPEMAVKKQRTYAEVASESTVKKFCVRENNPELSLDENKFQLFRAELSRRILDAAKSSGFVAQMLGCYLSDGVIMCRCSDDVTFKWFSDEIGKIKDIWGGCQLVIGDPPKPLLLLTWVPGPPENPDVVTTNIGVMNPSVSTKGWKVVRHNREANRLTIVYKVDRKSFDLIAGFGSSLQYVLERIRFRVISGP